MRRTFSSARAAGLLAALSLGACSQEAAAPATTAEATAPQTSQPAQTGTPASAGAAATQPRTGSSASTPSVAGAAATSSPAATAGSSAATTGAAGAVAAGAAGAVAAGAAGAVAAGAAGSGEQAAGGAPAAGAAAPPTTDPSGMQDAVQIAAAMRFGWNLGNSLDAVGGETAWGNPMVTPTLIKAIADAGFKVVRVPVTWVMHFGAGPTFTIDAAYMSRVEEIVKYVLDAGMYAIINVHHDGAEGGTGEWLSLRDKASGMASAANDMAVQQQFVALWKQIATHFAAHSDKLLFESMNEIKVGYDKPDPSYYKTINALNQVFVDTVRASGGNNMGRSLVVPGYNTNIEYTLEGFTAPMDPTPKRLLLSVHFYDPWSFAGEGSSHAWGMGSPGADTWGQEAWVDEQFEKLKTKYISAGLPVVMGEYGAVHQAEAQNYRRYYMEYVTKAAVDRGIVPVYWDNGGANSGGDGFGMFDRNSGQPLYPEVLKAMQKAATEDYPISAIAKP
jgi:endoglucanase